ncbi:MAG: ABC transporter permease [Erysipelotrichaceae bacterium]|jgi:ABC-type antimicrobial peptide transport system permease subunit|nr:ABC transporter permease [Bacillota bacterium]MDY0118326.1 ABC transporter permease [Bacilli bacterium]NLJ32428.1 ABC transporter permease [Erysipelotrichaceae bacterium]HOF65641.1 ABC transporter permease [Bacilli bacterium]
MKKTQKQWKNLIVFNNIRKDLIKNILSTLSLFVCLLASFVMVGFKIGNKIYLDNVLNGFLDNKELDFTKNEVINLKDSPLQLVRTTRPLVSEVESLKRYFPTLNYSISFLPLFSSGDYYFNDEKIQITPTFIRSFEQIDTQIVEQIKDIKDIDYHILINQTLKNTLIDKYGDEAINNCLFKLKLNYEIFFIDEHNIQQKDIIDIKLFLSLRAIINENDFMSTPKIYFSHCAWFETLNNYYLENFSIYKKTNTSIYTYLLQLPNHHPLTNYSFRIYFNNLEEVKKAIEMNKTLKSGTNYLQFNSPNLISIEVINSVVSFLDIALIGFLIISLLGTITILSIITYTKIYDKQKQIGILLSLNACRREVFLTYFKEGVIINSISLFAIFITKPIITIVNKYIFKYTGLKNIIFSPFLPIKGIPFFILFIVIISLIFITFIINLSVYLFIIKKPLVRSLSQE